MYKAVLVDDEKWILESLRGTVDWNELGFEIVAVAMNGIAGYELISELRPDVAFVDIRMPGMNGIEMIGKLKLEKVPTKPIIASGYSEFEYARQAMKYGAVGYCLKPFREEEITDILTTVRDALMSSDTLVPAEANAVGKETFRLIKKYIDEHYREPVSIQQIAKQFYVHPNYLSSLFKKEMQINFSKYLTDLRIKHACELLRSTTLSVSDIAEYVGYKDYFYFAKLFRKYIGKTPSEYRAGESSH